MNPNLHEKALSTWLLGCKYATVDNSRPPQELIDRVGINITTATLPYDLLVVDNGFKPLPIENIVALRSKCKDMLVFVSSDQAKKVMDKFRPSKTVKIKITPIRSDREPNYLFIYRG